jgi:bacteriophage N4 adsorption protein B
MVYCLVPLAGWILLSGLDDLLVSLVWMWPRRKRFHRPSSSELDAIPERRIAILVPLWREHRVIGQMLERNLAAVRYDNYDIFAGVYPNDELTLRAVADVARSHPRVHLALVPHGGPTSKGDCLNAIFGCLERYEERRGVHFETLITHDAEDLIHPESLRLVNWYARDYEMVQIPVLALPTGLREFTHGLYCDEFAEYQQKDIPVRQRLGGFLPSNGVGTGFDRRALEHMAAARHGMIFDPDCLTEDYENGYGLHELGYRQVFVPLQFCEGGPVATREYFPRNLRSAIRQRSRWVAGIALQGWQRHGWRVPASQLYWFWRDRKGLVGNLLSPFANALFLCGLGRWHAGGRMPDLVVRLCALTIGLSLAQAAVRSWCSARVYGWRFASAVVPRILWSNVVNCAATFSAIRQFTAARREGRSPAWRKTDHIYPVLRAPGQGRLGELLVRMDCLSRGDLDDALMRQPRHQRLGEHLLHMKKVGEEDLYRALSLQAGMEMGTPAPGEVSVAVTRTFPAAVVERWSVLPYRVHLGQLHIATTCVPCEEMARELACLSGLEFRFRLVRPAEFDRLRAEYLAQPAAG